MTPKFLLRIFSLVFLILSSSIAFAQTEEDEEATFPFELQPAYQREKLFLEPRMRSEGGYDLGNCLKTVEQEEALRMEQKAMGMDGQLSVFNPAWTFLGPKPGNVTNPNYGNVSGRVKAIAVASNGTTMYIGASGGGIWKSTDGGTTFASVGTTIASLSMGALAIVPGTDNTIYAGTGELNAGLAAEGNISGGGFFRSTDAGVSWKLLSDSTVYGYSDIIVHPGNTNIILAGTSVGVRRSTNGGTSFTTTFTPAQVGSALSLIMDPNNSSIFYCSSQFKGIYKSVDTGKTWTALAGGLPAAGTTWFRAELGMSKANSNVLYTTIFSYSYQLSAYKSVDAGANWTAITLPPQSDCGIGNQYIQGWYDLFITPDPSNEAIVYMGLIDLYKSVNSGATWTNLSKAYCAGTQMHPDVHTIAFLPTSSQTYWIGNDGGVWKTANGGTSFTNQNATLGNIQFYTIASDKNSATGIFGGAQDNCTQYLTSGTTFSQALGGDGFQVYYDPNNSSHAYTEIYYGRIFRTSTGVNASGFSEVLDNGLPPRNGSASPFFTHYVLDPANANTLYWANYDIYKSADQGDNWTKVSSAPLRTDSQYVAALTIAPNGTTLYAGIDKYLYKSTNSGVNWTQIKSFLYVIRRVVLSPANQNTIFVALAGSEAIAKNVQKSSDGGTNWLTVTGSAPNALPPYPCNTLFIHPDDAANTWFAGTDFGAYVTRDAGANWSRLDNNLPYVAVYDFSYYAASKKLRAGTYGRGIWEADVTTTPPVPAVVVVTPNGGERWRAGSVQNVTWTSSFVNGVNISLSTNGGTAFTTTVVSNRASGAGTNSYAWTIPATETTQGRIRIADTAAASTAKDTSNANFIVYVAQPVYTSTPVTTAKVGQYYKYKATVYDSASLVLTYTAPKKPTWATFNAAKDSLYGTPAAPGNDSVTLRATNSATKFTEQKFVITVTPSVDVRDEFMRAEGFTLGLSYPNPVRAITLVDVENPGGRPAALRVRTVLGIEVLSVEVDHSGKFLLDFTALPNGVYYYFLETSTGVLSRSLVVAH